MQQGSSDGALFHHGEHDRVRSTLAPMRRADICLGLVLVLLWPATAYGVKVEQKTVTWSAQVYLEGAISRDPQVIYSHLDPWAPQTVPTR
jgi:hypothetical protein